MPFLSEKRRGRLEGVLASRTNRLMLVLDNLYDPHNLSAILRTAEAFGVQHVLLTGDMPDGLNPQVSRGAQRWLTVRRERNPATAMETLKSSGFSVAATVLSEGAISPDQFAPAGPVALVLGNEHSGLQREWVDGADVHLKIPLPGFCQSLNVSVAAGILISSLLQKPALQGRGLPPPEAESLSAAWIRRSVPSATKILHGMRVRAGGTGED